MIRRPFAWWFLAHDLCARLTMPRTDVTTADWQFERALRESRLWSLGGNLVGTIRAAWLTSRLRSILRIIWSDNLSSDPRQAARAIGWAMTAAGVTSVIAQMLNPNGPDPLSWAVPAGVALVGLAMAW
jgi:hypothetical protein